MTDQNEILERMKYPRPQMIRDNYRILNEDWTLDGNPIRLPFPPQAAASGYEGEIRDDLSYELHFSLRLGWHNQRGDLIPCPLTPQKLEKKDSKTSSSPARKKRILLHFGAVDQYCLVFLNEKLVGSHRGGYLAFCFDITDALEEDNVLKVIATDSLSPVYPYGKQSKKPKGMWYTPVSGIWQEVWMEAVPERHADRLEILSDQKSALIRAYDASGEIISIDRADLLAPVSREGTGESISRGKMGKSISKGEARTSMSKVESGESMSKEEARESISQEKCSDGSILIHFARPHLWSPADPFLYRLRLAIGEDEIETYLGLRTVSMEGGKICCNGEPVYLHGLLDQGYWPQGIYLPETNGAYLEDIQGALELGFNCLRKHIKLEPERFYYACDAMGMLVLQDMVNSGKYDFMRDTALPNYGKLNRADDEANALRLPGEDEIERRAFFEQHLAGTIDQLRNHPSIIAYTIFNEGWGQYDADRLYRLVKEKDPGRLVDATSGWYAQKLSDFDSQHNYHRSYTLQARDKPLFLSECGGYTLAVEGHCMQKKRYGYGSDKKNPAELQEAVERLYRDIILPAIRQQGLVGSIYTQISDVEGEINGVFTYDRAVCKLDRDLMRALAGDLQEAFREACSKSDKKSVGWNRFSSIEGMRDNER